MGQKYYLKIIECSWIFEVIDFRMPRQAFSQNTNAEMEIWKLC